VDSDVFISHASEDKQAIAHPLADKLRKLGYQVWYDQFVLKLGDSLRREIDRGLARCRYGVVVLSPSFFAKHFPQLELDGLAARENVDRVKVILPIWHNIDQNGVAMYSPMLADRLAVNSARGIDEVVKKIVEVLGPPTSDGSPNSIEMAHYSVNEPVKDTSMPVAPLESDTLTSIDAAMDPDDAYRRSTALLSLKNPTRWRRFYTNTQNGIVVDMRKFTSNP
jgi:hypothetical protein